MANQTGPSIFKIVTDVKYVNHACGCVHVTYTHVTSSGEMEGMDKEA